jgi:dolichol-phosphate mannosyltransferase
VNITLSVVIPVLNKVDNLCELLPALHHVLNSIVESSYEIIVVDGDSTDATREVAAAHQAIAIQQEVSGYGGALTTGFCSSKGKYILTLDADLPHDPVYIKRMWRAREQAEIVIASRYISGESSSTAEAYSRMFSVALSRLLSTVLDVRVHDLSSGFRLYYGDAVRNLPILSHDFSALVEIVVRAYAAGWHVVEVPFDYRLPKHGNTHTRIVPFGVDFARTAWSMWKLRNSIQCADYDARAYDSRIPLQRSWQRKRYEAVTQFVPASARVLDIGCGSSRILSALTNGVGLDIQMNKLRFARCYGLSLVNGDVFRLPFRTGAFDCLVCSQLIEHLPAGDGPFSEMARVLRTGGHLILGTPDYGTVSWPIIERVYRFAAPNAYADEHITRYSKESLVRCLGEHGFKAEAFEYVFGSELIALFTRLP